MINGSETPYLSAATQLLLTTCLVVLLWALYTRLQRFEFFRWWAWAWTAFAVFLATASLSLRLGTTWTVEKVGLVLILIFAGYLQPVLLVFGGVSWQTPRKVSRRYFWFGIVVAVVVGLISFSLSLTLREFPLASFAVRNVPRTLAQAVALVFCCVVFWREFRKSGSYAALITGMFCLAYSFDQTLYFLSFSEMLGAHWNQSLPSLLHSLANLKYIGRSGLLFLDLLDTCGICLGMILLLVERYQQTATDLRVSEQQRLGLAVNNATLQFEIEARQRVEGELRRSENFSRRVVHSSPVAMVVSRGPQERVESVNAKFTSLFGYTRDEVRDVSAWWPLAYPDPVYRKSVQAQWENLIAQANRGDHQTQAMEARVCCKDGTFLDIEFHVSLVNDLYLVSFVDLTERKRVMEDLRKREDKFRLVVDTVSSAIWMLQEERFVYFNKEFERLTGYTREEILSMDPWELIDPDFRAENHANARARLAGEAVPTRYQFAILAKNGEKRWLDFTAALTEFNGKPAILASALDITAARRAERELKDHVMYMDALITNVPLGIVIKDENQLVRFCNPAFEHMFLYTQNEIQGKNLDDFIASHDREEANQLSKLLKMAEWFTPLRDGSAKTEHLLTWNYTALRFFPGNRSSVRSRSIKTSRSGGNRKKN